MASIPQLIRKRAGLRHKLTTLKLFVESISAIEVPSQLQLKELQIRSELLQQLMHDFDSLQSNIEVTCDEEDIANHFAYRDEFTDIHTVISAKCALIVDRFSNIGGPISEPARSVLSDNSVSNSPVTNIKLPVINLPKFNGDYKNWLEFKDTFESLIHTNETINPIQKFHYLRASLQPEPLKVIQSLEFSSVNYSSAWDLLCARYNNSKLLIHNHIKALFDLPVMTRESAGGLRTIVDSVAEHLRALETLKQPTVHWDTIIIFLIAMKLDKLTGREWEKYKSDIDCPTLDEFYKFLRSRADLLETLEFKQSNSIRNDKPIHKVAMVSANRSCNFCKGNHTIYFCEEFLKLSVKERLNKVKQLKLCENCLWIGHFANKCRSSSCKKCNKRHNTLLHENSHCQANNNSVVSQPVADSSSSAPQISLSAYAFDRQVILSTVIVEVVDKFGKEHTLRALLDCGSQSNFISEKTCKILNLRTSSIDMSVTGLNNSQSSISAKCTIKIRSISNKCSHNISCYVVPQITNSIPDQEIDTSRWNIPQNIPLADPRFYLPNEIDLLIGAGLFWDTLSNHTISLGPGLPMLRNTAFGWIVTGQISDQPKRSTCHFLRTNSLSENLKTFWEIEENHSPSVSVDDLDCEQHFIRHVSRDGEGRFIVRIPLKYPPSFLGNSKDSALKRLFQLERKLTSNSDMRNLYVQFINEYYKLDHMSLVNDSDVSNDAYYLPHHGVIKEDSLTTKLRVVFDGSNPTSSGWSLNDLQHIGPSIINDIFSMLLRFRQHNVVVTADVEKMYRQILVHPKDRYLQQILWRDSMDDTITTYRLNTVTYGTSSAPYLAMRCLKQLAEENSKTFPISSDIIIKDFYVDDLITGFDTEEEAISTCKEVSSILRSAKFCLRKWHSNSQCVLTELQSSKEPNSVIPIGNLDSIKTLGIHWNSESDKLMYVVPQFHRGPMVTKRSVLSDISRIFDPLGLISPCVILVKIIIQNLWSLQLKWDEPIPGDLQNKWFKFCTESPDLNNLAIERHAISNSAVRIELHAFCDASQHAYAASVYLRSINQDQSVNVELLCAKTKVAPLKALTIPRLELCSALLLTKLVKRTSESLNIAVTSFYWTDSQIVLAWLQVSPKKLQPFVANRVSEVQSSTDVSCWHHVSSKDNPADLGSRGVMPNALLKSQLWWHGPSWLSLTSDRWPISQSMSSVDLPMSEMKNQKSVFVTIEAQPFPFKQFSNLIRLRRVSAYCLRFVSNCRTAKTNRQTGPLQIIELASAMKVLVRMAQLESFPEDIKNLISKGQVKGNLAKLTPFVDDEGLLRVGGRLGHSDLNYITKHPLLLNGNHHLSRLIMEHDHKSLLHAGPQLLLSNVRQTYWPTSGIQLAKKVTRSCVKCFRFNPRYDYPQMADLPKNRVTASYPFQNTGVDFAGPFHVKDRKSRGAKTTKAYICLFICFSSKAIHLELATELTTVCVLACLRRFVARRGKPTNIYSDNGTNFVGASNEFKLLYTFLKQSQGDLQSHCVQEAITWHFSPPASPHFGGLWESNIKSVKRHLLKTIGDVKLTYEEFLTILVQVEGILNSRPLFPLSSDPNDLEPLTPFHFLIGRHFVHVPESIVLDAVSGRLPRHQLLQQIKQGFWSRWSREYLGHLQQRSKWKSTTPNLLVGSMVLLKRENLPPFRWPLARVVELHPGHDGVVRVVSVRTAIGLYKRAVVNVCALPQAEH